MDILSKMIVANAFRHQIEEGLREGAITRRSCLRMVYQGHYDEPLLSVHESGDIDVFGMFEIGRSNARLIKAEGRFEERGYIDEAFRLINEVVYGAGVQ